MKNKMYIIIAFLTLNKLVSQTNYSSNTVKANKSQFIFEATVNEVEVFAGDKNGNKLNKNSIKWNDGVGTFYDNAGKEGIGYIKAKLNISKIYKGEIKNSVVEVIYKSVTIQNVQLMVSKNDTALSYMYVPPSEDPDFIILPSFKNQKYLFFCNSIADIKNYTFPNRNSTESNIDVVDNISFGSKNSDMYASGFNNFFKTQEELNTFLNTFDGINISQKETTIEKKSTVINEKELNEILEINKSRYESWLNTHTKTNPTAKQNAVLANVLNLSMANPRLTDTLGFNWLEFDILMSANTSTAYFDGFLAHIQYNTSAFGTNMIANNNIIATQPSQFSSPTYTNPNAYWSDNGSNIVAIPFVTSASGPYNRTLCSLTPKVVLTLKFKIQNCNISSNILFTNSAFTSSFGFYTPTASGSLTTSVGFSNTTYAGTINDQTCLPLITSFNNNIPAGIGRTFVINGRYFGKKKRTGTVIFKNADKGTVYPNVGGAYDGGVQPYDIISWNDSQIKIKLPGVIDSVPSTGISTPGTGKFQVRNFTNTKAQSSSILTIPYAIYQLPASTPTYIKFTIQLAGQAPTFGYDVRCNANVTTAFPNAKPVIKRALKEWNCNTGINWRLTRDTALATSSDGISVINIGTFSALQRTQRDIKYCNLGGGSYRAYERSFDIEINQLPSFGTWQVDSGGTLLAGKYDFYSAISHELGHAHLVEHINDSIGDVMWWAQYAQPFNQTNRKIVSVSYGANSAGNYITDSLNLALPCYGNHIQTIPQNCQGLLYGVKSNYGNLFDIKVYPNPSNASESLKIKFNLSTPQNITVNLFDITGLLVSNSYITDVKDEEYIFANPNLSNGIYLLQIDINGKKQSYKIIKQ